MVNRNLSPHLYAIATIFVGCFAFFFFRSYSLLDKYFYLPLVLLALILAASNLLKQVNGDGYYAIDYRVTGRLLRRALARYLVWLAVFSSAYLLFRELPINYQIRYRWSLDFLKDYLQLYVLLGFPYFVLTLMVKASRVEDYYDTAVRIIHITRSILLRGNGKRPGVFRVLARPYNRKVLLNLVLRGYFIPPMVMQIHQTMATAISASSGQVGGGGVDSLLLCIAALLWCMDATVGGLSYAVESRWLENRTRSIDLSVGGWLICLSCYAPANGVTSALFPFAPSIVDNQSSSLIFDNTTLHYTILIVQNMLLAMLLYTDASLGPSAANITLKKLQTRGFYGWVRHPAYLFKLSMWWWMVIFYKKFWAIKYLFGMMMWSVIYLLRALSEERHLSQFPEYREYKKRVRYRFLPGVF